ncbi:MAG: thiamine pyrophosphate-dependent enzyme, partial [Candidatus Longimicrobiales bacterium M2_2A_002]
HTTVDDPSRYRSEEEVEEWEARDPIPRFRDYLEERGVLDEDALDEIDAEVDGEVEAGWDEAQERMAELGEPAAIFEHLLAGMPPYLRAQRDAAVGDADRPGAGGPGASSHGEEGEDG